jgi:hypothetical protein
MVYDLPEYTQATLDYYSELLKPTDIDVDGFCRQHVLISESEVSIRSLRDNLSTSRAVLGEASEIISNQMKIVADAFDATYPDLGPISRPENPLWGVDVFNKLIPKVFKTGTIALLSIGVIAPDEVPGQIKRTAAQHVDFPSGFDMNVLFHAQFGGYYGQSEAGFTLYPAIYKRENRVAKFLHTSIQHYGKRTTAERQLALSRMNLIRTEEIQRRNSYGGGLPQ